MLFLECPMPVLSDQIKFDSFSTTLKIYAPKIPMKYSKKCQNFAISNFTIDVLFETCWTPCKKLHVSSWSRTKFTFFWSTLYLFLCIILVNQNWRFSSAVARNTGCINHSFYCLTNENTENVVWHWKGKHGSARLNEMNEKVVIWR